MTHGSSQEDFLPFAALRGDSQALPCALTSVPLSRRSAHVHRKRVNAMHPILVVTAFHSHAICSCAMHQDADIYSFTIFFSRRCQELELGTLIFSRGEERSSQVAEAEDCATFDGVKLVYNIFGDPASFTFRTYQNQSSVVWCTHFHPGRHEFVTVRAYRTHDLY